MASVDILKLNEQIQAESQFLGQIQAEVRKVIVGQEYRGGAGCSIGLLAQGHILLEGVPGLAKTLSPCRRSPAPSTAASSGSSSPPTCFRPTSPAP